MKYLSFLSYVDYQSVFNKMVQCNLSFISDRSNCYERKYQYCFLLDDPHGGREFRRVLSVCFSCLDWR